MLEKRKIVSIVSERERERERENLKSGTLYIYYSTDE